MDLLKAAAAEFPNDAELKELEKLATDGLQRKGEAQRLMTEGQDLCAQQKPIDGLKLLREAYELDENNSLTRAIFANALVEYAQSLVDTDWKEADKLAKEAVDLNPDHPMTKTLRTSILDRRRETFVDDCVSQARKLQASGDLPGALARIEEGIATYPREARLIQIQEAVQKDLQTQRRQTRRRDLDELRRLEDEIEKAPDIAVKQSLGARAKTLADKYVEDDEVLKTANGLLQRLDLPTVGGKASGSSPGNESATLAFDATATMDVPAPAPPVISPPAPPEPPKVASPPPLPVTPKAPKPKVKRELPKFKMPAIPPFLRDKKILGGGAAAVALLLMLVLLLRHHSEPNISPTSTATEATPAAGNSVTTPQPNPTPAAEAPAALKLSSDTTNGKVYFDNESPAELKDAQWTLATIADGEHRLKFESSKGAATVDFVTAADTIPVIKTPISAKNVLAVVASNSGNSLKIFSSDRAARVSVDKQSAHEVPESGLEISSVAAGAHELVMSLGNDQYTAEVETGVHPTMSVFLESGQDVGTLIVVTNQDKAKVFLNGKAVPQATESGELRIPNLEPKDYAVKVSKNGFQELPDQNVRIRKGKQSKLVFNLQAIQHLASLSIQNGIPGALIFIDQNQVGTIRPDGTLNVSTVNPGDHVVEIRKDRFKPKQIKEHFVVGSVVTLGAAEVAMEAGPGEVKISFNPPDSVVTITKAGEAAIKVNNGTLQTVPARKLHAKCSNLRQFGSHGDSRSGRRTNQDFEFIARAEWHVEVG